MSRLIDADLLKKNCKCTGEFEDYFKCVSLSELAKVIDEQPTVFDVDKVVEQLKDLKAMYWFSIANTGDKKLDIAYENVGNALDRAIEIVKEGGVE